MLYKKAQNKFSNLGFRSKFLAITLKTWSIKKKKKINWSYLKILKYAL